LGYFGGFILFILFTLVMFKSRLRHVKVMLASH
jgi:hypothetical protein